MEISEATLKALKELGLTEYELQAYVALVDGGQMTASDVASESNVPFSRVYDVLGRLEERGFIQIQRGRPTNYIAKAPTEIVRLVKIAWEQKFENAGKVIVDELQPRFEKETHATSRDVWLLFGRAAILAKALEMLDSAKDSIMLSIPSLDMSDVDEGIEMDDLSDLIEKILGLKTQTYILTANVPDDIKDMIPDRIQLRTRDRVFGAGLVVDRLHTLIMLSGQSIESDFMGIYSSHAVFAEMANSYFDSLWNESEPVE